MNLNHLNSISAILNPELSSYGLEPKEWRARIQKNSASPSILKVQLSNKDVPELKMEGLLFIKAANQKLKFLSIVD